MSRKACFHKWFQLLLMCIALALLSAIPQPDPLTERKKVVEVYDPSCHHYETDKPEWTEIEEGHFVLANKEEQQNYKEVLKRG